MAVTDINTFIPRVIQQQISEGNFITLCVTGKSMRPYLTGTGSEFVIVSIHHPEELKPGIIIMFSHNGKYIFHRIVKKLGNILIVQGDGNYIKTETVRPDDVLGIVRYVIRKGEKKTSPYGLAARIYWQIWYLLRPIRKYLLLTYNLLNK